MWPKFSSMYDSPVLLVYSRLAAATCSLNFLKGADFWWISVKASLLLYLHHHMMPLAGVQAQPEARKLMTETALCSALDRTA